MRLLLLGFTLLCSSLIHAQHPISVTTWTQKTLMNALSVNYKYGAEEEERDKVGFMPVAWDALTTFLGGYMKTVQDKQLTIHPQFLIKPTIVDSGTASGIKFWRVNEEVLLPELNVKVAFSLIVIASTPSAAGGYLIQSMSMEKQENP